MVKGGSYVGKHAREFVAFSCRETLEKAVVTRDSRAIGHLGSMQFTRERQGYEIVFYCVQQPPEGHQHEARFASQSHWEIAVHDVPRVKIHTRQFCISGITPNRIHNIASQCHDIKVSLRSSMNFFSTNDDTLNTNDNDNNRGRNHLLHTDTHHALYSKTLNYIRNSFVERNIPSPCLLKPEVLPSLTYDVI